MILWLAASANAASLGYEPGREENLPLSKLGVVAINKAGMVASDAAKSGSRNSRRSSVSL